MINNKPCCCKNNAETSYCSKKENSCGNSNLNNTEEIRNEVSKVYSQYAKEESHCSCKSKKYAMSLGYSEKDISGENIPIGSLSCGNPVGLADLREGKQ